jgi:bifunctional isochorismate lyase/aryl carrier protein
VSQPMTEDQLRIDVAELLAVDPASIRRDDNLVDAGLDSIRIMTLSDRWQAAGAEIGFMELAENPTLQQWWELVRGS